MAIRRPFAQKSRKEPLDENRGTLQPTNPPRLPLPTPRLQPQETTRPAQQAPRERVMERQAGEFSQDGISLHRLERAKQVFQSAGLDPSTIDRLVERTVSIDKEVEKLQLQIEELQGKIRQLLEEKERISRIINALAQA